MKRRNPRSGDAAPARSGWRAHRLPESLEAELLELEAAAAASRALRQSRRPSRRAAMMLLAVSPLILYACTAVLTKSRAPQPNRLDEVASTAARRGSMPLVDEPPPEDLAYRRTGALHQSPETDPAEKPYPDSDDADLWERIRAGLKFATKVDNPLVTEQIHWFTRDPASLRMVQRRARPYLHFIVEEVERRGLPMELALLPIVESAFRPLATSEDRAAGIWQFIPSTGRRFGLEENPWHDDRRDIVQSTRAALDMLRKLNRSFRGDWELALAAYNAGIGRVREEQEFNRLFEDPTDFWSLELPGETRYYVRRVLAIAQLVNRPQQWGVRLEEMPDRPYFTSVPLDRPLDLSIAAGLAETSVHELYRLNPGLKRWTVAADGPIDLNIPAEQAAVFMQRLGELKPEEHLHTREYKVKAGDTLERIALRYGLRSEEIQAANPQIKGTPEPGQTLQIPLSNLPLDQMALLQRALNSS